MKPTTAGTEGGDKLTPYAYKGRVYYFTGMTSVNEHQSSILGYTFVDARTNTLHYYREHGNVMTPERAISYAQQDINPQTIVEHCHCSTELMVIQPGLSPCLTGTITRL